MDYILAIHAKRNAQRLTDGLPPMLLLLLLLPQRMMCVNARRKKNERCDLTIKAKK